MTVSRGREELTVDMDIEICIITPSSQPIVLLELIPGFIEGCKD